MQAIDAIKYLGEMSGAPLLRPGPQGGNHAMWIVGHSTAVEGRLHQMLRGHLGGLNIVRAAAGKQRLFVPSKDLREF
jgi:hypothetical protein